MTNIIAFANQKGGVGKTTTAINIGASLAAIKKRVLLVDLDQQGNAGTGLGFERASHRQSVYGVIMGTANAADNILSTAVPRLHLLPSSQALAGADVDLLDMPNREFRLRDALRPIMDYYDYILLDCPPALGYLTINALTTADSVIIPLQCEFFALEGVQQLTDTIDIVKADNTDDFYLEFPSEEEQYGSVWNVKYFNGTENKVTWKADSAKKDLELDGDGSFLIDMGENNESLIVNYTDANNISWKYEFDTEIIIYAPTIKLLEEYDGSRVKSSSLVLSGKVDDASAMVKINGREVEVDKNGMFTDMVTLETGKNVINLEASNKVGKTKLLY